MPSDLLCGETFTWHSIEKCLPKLEVTKYCRFEDNPNAIDSNGHNISDSEIKILYKGYSLSFSEYKTLKTTDNNEEQEVKEYAKLVGRKASQKMLLYRSG